MLRAGYKKRNVDAFYFLVVPGVEIESTTLGL